MCKQMFNHKAHDRHNFIHHNNNAGGCDLECPLTLMCILVNIQNPRYHLSTADLVIYSSYLVRAA